MENPLNQQKWLLITILLFILFMIPILTQDSYLLHILIMGAIYAILASSWDILAGYTGLLSFAHSTFFGIGAYVSALSYLNLGLPPPSSFVLGGLMAIVLGLMLGLITLRLKGPYFAITTISFNGIVWLIINNEEEITRGPLGLNVPPIPTIPSEPFAYRLHNYYIALTILMIYSYLSNRLIKSKAGYAFRAILNDEDSAKKVGINTVKYKIISFVITSFIAGLMGGYYAHYIMLISPAMLSLETSVMIIAMSVFGGMGTLVGPMFGAFFFIILTEYLRGIFLYRYLLFGAILSLMILFAPEGIFGIGKNITNTFLKYVKSSLPHSKDV